MNDEVHIALILTNKQEMRLNRFYLSLYFTMAVCSPSLIVFYPGDMLDLLKWRAHPERINDSLSKLKEIDGSEIVKVSLHSHPLLFTHSEFLIVLFIWLFCTSFYRTPWTPSLGFWTKARRDMGSRCLIHW